MSVTDTVREIRALLGDGFQLSDLGRAAELAYAEIRTGELSGILDSTERAAAVVTILERAIDETDGPGPDWVVDPIAKAAVRLAAPGVVAWVERLAIQIRAEVLRELQPETKPTAPPGAVNPTTSTETTP